jgi:hypothetical protein
VANNRAPRVDGRDARAGTAPLQAFDRKSQYTTTLRACVCVLTQWFAVKKYG